MKNRVTSALLAVLLFSCSLILSAQDKRSEYERALSLIEEEKYDAAYPFIKGLYDRPGDLSEQERFNVAQQLGIMYFRGLGTEWDIHKAYEILSAVAEQGYVPAQILLGNIISGNHGGGQFEWYNDYLNFLDEMGWYDSEPRKVPARYWYQKAVDAGSPEGMFFMGVFLENHESDKDGAMYYYRMAHDEGYHLATFVLGDIYLDGSNLDIASKFFKEAADAAPEFVYCGFHADALESICAFLAKNKDLALANGPFQYPDFTHHYFYVLPDAVVTQTEKLLEPRRERTEKYGLVNFSFDGTFVSSISPEYDYIYYDFEDGVFECHKNPTDDGNAGVFVKLSRLLNKL